MHSIQNILSGSPKECWLHMYQLCIIATGRYLGMQAALVACLDFKLIKSLVDVELYCFRDVMEKSFPEFYDYYLSVIGDNSHLNGQNMQVGTFICKYILDSPNCNNVVFENAKRKKPIRNQNWVTKPRVRDFVNTK